jgi:glycosyltransferase involved in cell wall biosynthesis
VDSTIFRPASIGERECYRRELGLDGFVFLNLGAMSTNKGLDLLLRGFAAVLEHHPDARLVLKGLTGMYDSQQRVARALSMLSVDQQSRVIDRLSYIGDPMTSMELAQLYCAADAYVAPYRAEGFNMPALEAAACGVPVICTRGGSTDDFVDDSFAQKISSKLVPAAFVGDGSTKNLGFALKPDLDHLVQLLHTLIEDRSISETARRSGPDWVRARFTWQLVVDQLLDVMLDRTRDFATAALPSFGRESPQPVLNQ